MADDSSPSLRKRLILLFTVIQTAIVVAVATVVIAQSAWSELQTQRQLTQHLLKLAKPTVTDMVLNRDTDTLKTYLENLAFNTSIAAIDVSDTSGAISIHMESIYEEPSLLTSLFLPGHGQNPDFQIALRQRNINYGIMRVTLSSKPINDRISTTINFYLLILAIILALTLLLTFQLARVITEPLKDLEKAAGNFARGKWDSLKSNKKSKYEEFNELGTAMNSSARIISEHIEELENTKDILQRSEDQLRTLVNNTREVLFELDTLGRIRFLNPGWQNITGFSLNTSIGSKFTDFLVNERDYQIFSPEKLSNLDLINLQLVIKSKDNEQLWIELDARSTFTADGNFSGVVGSFQDISQRKKYENTVRRHQRELYSMSITDPLTGVANRRHFDKMLAEILPTSIKENTTVCLILVDLDGFKSINDTYGHPVGDKVLKTLANLLTSQRPKDIVARLASDEYALIIRNVDLKAAREIAEKLQDTITNTRIPLPIGHIHLQASMGVAVAPFHGSTCQQLMGAADVALFQSKQRGRGRIEVLSSDISQAIREVFSRGFELRNALAAGNIQPTFQPIVDLKSGHPIAYEVLANMKRGEYLLPANEFIKVAEDLGLVREVDLHITEQALKQTPKDVELFFNVSLLSFYESNFGNELRDLLGPALESGRPVTLEITERETPMLEASVINEISKLKDLGCKIALDDFGQGYSTYDYLRRFRPEYIKIDSNYISGVLKNSSDRMIVEHIFNLSKSFNAINIAEGIENSELQNAVFEMGITCGQGYHFGRPATAREIFKHSGSAA